jgi:uncharacterized protein
MAHDMSGNISPSQPGERIQDIDILRGFALFGVILVNVFYFHVPDVHFSAYYGQFTGLIDRIVFLALNWFVDRKFYPIFSFLFGLGFALQFMKARQKGVNPYLLFLRRLLTLALFGLAHIVLVWEEDILFIYAVFGFVLLMLAERPPRFIVITALVLYAIPVIYKAAGHLIPVSQMPVNTFALTDYIRFYTNSAYHEILQVRLELYLHKFDQWAGLFSILDRLAFFLLGLYAGHQNYIATFSRTGAQWRRVFSAFLLVYVVGFLTDKLWLKDLELAGERHLLFVEEIVLGVTQLFQIGIYIIGFLLLLTIPVFKRLALPLADIGRLALTTYIGHTLLFSVLFYSFGWGFYGSLSPSQLLLVALGYYAFMVVFSSFWLRGFSYGPLEWLWRSLTYGRRLPIKRPADGSRL